MMIARTPPRRFRITAALAVAVLAIASCGSADTDTDTDSDTDTDLDIDAEPLEPIDREPTGAASIAAGATWQWQLQGAINTSYDVDVYDIDLFDTPHAVIDELRGDGRVVICYYSAGSYEEWRSDADSYPAVTLGAGLDGWEGERWVDIRSDAVRAVIEARHVLAVEKRCDGVEPDNVTAFRNDTGFDLTAADQLDFNRFLAESAHDHGLLIALKNDLEQIPDLVADFDFAVNEECAAFVECDAYAPFIDAGKAVLNAEYADAFVDDPDEACAVASSFGLSTLILPLDLDDTFRIAC